VNVYLSIVSHHNTREIIHGLQPHKLQQPGWTLLILDNQPDPALAHYCQQHQLTYLANEQRLGFGANHNRVFRHCQYQLGMTPGEDWFVILNPDLETDSQALAQLIKGMQQEGAQIGAPNIFKDPAFTQHEESVRRFPYLWELLPSFLLRQNRTGVDRHMRQPCPVDWASGACLAFKADLYQALGGFDEGYFLYYEDVDFCWRARHLMNQWVYYIPAAKMVHKGKRASHTLNNKHLWWHLTSALRFSWIRTKTALFGAKALR